MVHLLSNTFDIDLLTDQHTSMDGEDICTWSAPRPSTTTPVQSNVSETKPRSVMTCNGRAHEVSTQLHRVSLAAKW